MGRRDDNEDDEDDEGKKVSEDGVFFNNLLNELSCRSKLIQTMKLSLKSFLYLER